MTEIARIAVITAFEPEFEALRPRVAEARDIVINGATFVTGTLSGKAVVVAMSGISMVNAAMTTQLLIDRFDVSRVVFSGIAGGIDPALGVGDVVLPERWVSNLDGAFGRKGEGGYVRPAYFNGLPDVPPFGALFPTGVRVGNAQHKPLFHEAFHVDPAMLDVARGLTVELKTDPALGHAPQVVIGGTGVSGPAFVDNADYRDYLHRTFGARAADMESAAAAQVCFVNEVPFIALRSLSDLAGAEPDENRMMAFWHLASENAATVVEAFIAALPDPIA